MHHGSLKSCGWGIAGTVNLRFHEVGIAPSRCQHDLKQTVTQRGGVYPQQTPIPTSAEGFLVAVEIVAQGALRAKVDKHVFQRKSENGVQGHGADTPVFLHPHRILQQADGRSRALVDGGIEHQQGQRRWKVRTVNRIPVIAAVDRRGVLQRQRADIEVGDKRAWKYLAWLARRGLGGGPTNRLPPNKTTRMQ